MDWSRTKTIFIVTFLLLNSFLVYQLMEKRAGSQLNVRAEATIEERMSEMNITVTEELPEDMEEISHIVGQVVDIEEEVSGIVGEENVTENEENDLVEVSLEEPYDTPEGPYDSEAAREAFNESVTDFVENNVYEGEEYVYGEWDNENREMHFYQTFEDAPIYTSEENQLVLTFNEDTQITGYSQIFLDLQEQDDKKDMFLPYLAIERLLNENLITFNDSVTEVEIGYFNFFSPIGNSRVFSPMYQITINDDEEYLVNAIDGAIQEMTEVDSADTDEEVNESEEADSSEEETEETEEQAPNPQETAEEQQSE